MDVPLVATAAPQHSSGASGSVAPRGDDFRSALGDAVGDAAPAEGARPPRSVRGDERSVEDAAGDPGGHRASATDIITALLERGLPVGRAAEALAQQTPVVPDEASTAETGSHPMHAVSTADGLMGLALAATLVPGHAGVPTGAPGVPADPAFPAPTLPAQAAASSVPGGAGLSGVLAGAASEVMAVDVEEPEISAEATHPADAIAAADDESSASALPTGAAGSGAAHALATGGSVVVRDADDTSPGHSDGGGPEGVRGPSHAVGRDRAAERAAPHARVVTGVAPGQARRAEEAPPELPVTGGPLPTVDAPDSGEDVEATPAPAPIAPAPASPTTPTPPAADPVAPSGDPAPAPLPPVQVRGTVLERIQSLVDQVRNAPPPRHVVVQLPDLAGLRLEVRIGVEGAVHVMATGGADVVGSLESIGRDLADALAQRGLELGGFETHNDDDDGPRRRQPRAHDDPDPNAGPQTFALEEEVS